MAAERREEGQALLLVVGALCAVLVGAGVLGTIARGIGDHEAHRSAADLAALAGADAMRRAQPRLFEPATIDGVPNPRHLERGAYLDLARRAARETAARNGAAAVEVTFPDADAIAPVRIAVTIRDRIRVAGRRLPDDAHAVAEVAPVLLPSAGGDLSGAYRGPLALRQGKPMRPDVAQAFDRMSAAARADGVALIVTSGYRSDAEQARLWAAHPDPKWVARPGTSLHRLGTELDLGPASAYAWLAGNASRFGFRQRYAWEPWHYGFVRAAGSRSVGYGPGDGRRGMPSFVPEQWAPAISRAAQHWNVGAALLAAQLMQESHFNPFARSPAGALGIAQFMPGTAAAYGLSDPFDGEAAIMAQAHLMHDLLGQLGSVPLALAAYNAGSGAVAACGCVPSIPETTAYVAAILGLLGGAGDAAAAGAGLQVRLVA
ncbi:MAG TPA: transglycosylase SLT domain-containing protein [Baekduia sp.]|nr:transglycosylase SLT domain-containing protein [Baekduia sp.]